MTTNPELEPATDWLEEVDHEGCHRLLAALDLGRMAVVDDGLPSIVVLNYALVGDDLAFLVGQDTRLARITADGRGVPAAFEVDSAFPAGHAGWSVIAAGRLERELDPERQSEARTLVRPWAEGGRHTVLALRSAVLTGRRVAAH
jgi:uncharacterized protein